MMKEMNKKTLSIVITAIIITLVFIATMSTGTAKPTSDPDEESWLGDPDSINQDVPGTKEDYMIRDIVADCEARPGTYTDYSFTEIGPFYNLDTYVTWEIAPSHGYIYPAFTYSFQAEQGGYMGTQLVGDTKKAIFSIWTQLKIAVQLNQRTKIAGDLGEKALEHNV